ncbi:DUF4097 family beta strand repeat-containing protein [Romboutsia sp. Marseille-P6047]|uniref:DUF4097 family beta strand repeat-containing protein n=1 Tax=Romboutsia sp. Marseille-P6047 TaxID=2161817 RepID=UPI000F04EE9E|nr:DUF4097 family beta strand repeat-containing protein [Romboutsia sp. Marseille-P6047]
MRRRFNIFKMIFCSAITLGLVCVFTNSKDSQQEVFSAIKSNYINYSKDLNVVSESKLSLKNINDINLDLDVDDVTFLENTEDKIKIVEKCNRELSEKEQLKIEEGDNSINIYRNSKLDINSVAKSFKRELLIYLPSSYNKNLNVTLSIGDINFTSDLNLENLEIYLSTGDVNIDKNVNCKSFIAESSTGDMNINYLSANSYGIGLNTGSVDVSTLLGQGYINITTGDIKCGISNLTGNTELSSSIGDITVNIQKENKFLLDTSCDIGEVDTDFKSNSIGKNPKNILKVKCGCGDIKINKNY